MSFSFFARAFLVSVLPVLVLLAALPRAGAFEDDLMPAAATVRVDGGDQDRVLATHVDASGNIYVVGSFTSDTLKLNLFGEADIENPEGDVVNLDLSEQVHGGSGEDIFVAKLGSDGEAEWVQIAPSTQNAAATGVVTDEDGNVYVSGWFEGTTTFNRQVTPEIHFDGGQVSLTANVFVAKLSPGGGWQWVEPLELSLYTFESRDQSTDADTSSGELALVSDRNRFGMNKDGGAGNSLGIDEDGNLYITGVTRDNTIRSWNTVGRSFIAMEFSLLSGLVLGVGEERIDVPIAASVYGDGEFNPVYNLWLYSRIHTERIHNPFIAKLGAPELDLEGSEEEREWKWMRPVHEVERFPVSGMGSFQGENPGTNRIRMRNMEVSSEGDIVLGVAWNDVIDFGGTTYETDDWSGLVARLNSDGEVRLAREIRSSGWVDPSAVLYDAENERIYAAGVVSNSNEAAFSEDPGEKVVAGPGQRWGWVGRLDATGNWNWVETFEGEEQLLVSNLLRDSLGDFYVSGSFQGGAVFDDHSVSHHSAVFEAPYLARLIRNDEEEREWGWALAPPVQPRYESEDEVISSIDTAYHDAGLLLGPAGNLIWALRTGSHGELGENLRTEKAMSTVSSPVEFSPFGLSDRLDQDFSFEQGPDQHFGHGASLYSLSAGGELEGEFAPVARFVAGQAIEPPDGAHEENGRTLQPEIFRPDGSEFDWSPHFFWDDYAGKLHAVSPIVAELRWPVDDDPQNEERIEQIVAVSWPDETQGLERHLGLAGPEENEPVVPLNPVNGAYRFGSVLFSQYDAELTSDERLIPDGVGFSTLLYFEGEDGIQGEAPARLQVVETVDWREDVQTRGPQAATIGAPLDGSEWNHDDPEGKNGFVVSPTAPFDGAGGSASHIREEREGRIIPVNTSNPEGVDPLDVLWYRSDEIGVGWPSVAVRYKPDWPEHSDHIIIASQRGSELTYKGMDGEENTHVYEQPLLTEEKFPSPEVYRQPDRDLPGYNPNEEHALVLPSERTGEAAVYALRNDLNHFEEEYTSDPYVLLKYEDPDEENAWRFRVYRVLVEGSAERMIEIDDDSSVTGETDSYYFEDYTAQAGDLMVAPYPLSAIGTAPETEGGGDAFWVDVNGDVWARSAGEVIARYHYPVLEEFDFPGEEPAPESTPWLGYYEPDFNPTPPGEAIEIRFTVDWPDEVPTLRVGDTLTEPRDGLPGVIDWVAGTMIYDDNEPELGHADSEIAAQANPLNTTSRLIDATSERSVPIENGQVDGLSLDLGDGFLDIFPVEGGYFQFPDLPQSLRDRLRLDARSLDDLRLAFRGHEFTQPIPPVLMPNIMTPLEKENAIEIGDGLASWEELVEALFIKTRNPNLLDLDDLGNPDERILTGLKKDDDGVLRFEDLKGGLALTAGLAQGTGYVTLAENNDPDLTSPVSLHILRVETPPSGGRLVVVPSVNALNEYIWIRHAFDFSGDPGALEFDWYYTLDTGDTPPEMPEPGEDPGGAWNTLTGAGEETEGLHEIRIGGPGLRTLSNLFVIGRYTGYGDLNENDQDFVTEWVGQDRNDPLLVQGWIDRVLEGIGPFEERANELHTTPASTYVSMIRQAGQHFEGPVALNDDPEFLQQVGLIELYETVLRRGMNLSIEAGDPVTNPAVNNALLRAATRISDFYMLLGNEAYADAQDPTIGFTTSDGEIGSLAPALHAFANQQPSLLHEELALLRGRDGSGASVTIRPVYNRLFWNFTGGLEGEPAYVQNYNITDQTGDGAVTEQDAAIMYPQGHGDAWGHYLTALKSHYRLMRHPEFDWIPRTQSTTVGGIRVEVDYFDEQKFARAAAARARAGAETVNVTYRKEYTANPAGQWQGYRDTDRERAWGVDDWGRRAGQGAYFDWATANAVLPERHDEHLDPEQTDEPSGLARIDRETVKDLREIPAAFNRVQGRLDESDRGLNPLGIAEGDAIPFDIDPSRVDEGDTHFEQIYERALGATDNARLLWDYANELSNRLRQLEVTSDDFAREVQEEELHFKNRLIEIFGYPYAGDIGPGEIYPDGYDGPDIYNYMYIDTAQIVGEIPEPADEITAYYEGIRLGPADDESIEDAFAHFFESDAPSVQTFDNQDQLLEIDYRLSTPEDTGSGWAFQATPDMGSRRAPGEIQMALQAIVELEAELLQALGAYRRHVQGIEDQIELLEAQYGMGAEQLELLNYLADETVSLNEGILDSRRTEERLELAREISANITEAIVEAMPIVAGFSTDVTSVARGAVRARHAIFDGIAGGFSQRERIRQNEMELAKENLELTTNVEIEKLEFRFEIRQQLKEIEERLREEMAFRLDLLQKQLELESASGRVQQAIAEGQRVLEKRAAFRRRVAGAAQVARYQDMTFRNFRNDALQKYRASFDLAARYVYLAAKTYDYETNLVGGDSASGERFFNNIIRERAIGQFIDGVPIHGVEGLSDPLARMEQNFDVLKGQLGFNNPQVETGRFSLRRELFRIREDSEENWRHTLDNHRVDDLWEIPEFRRYMRPFAPEAAGPQPGIVLRFSSDITFGHNFFGRTLGGGDSAYDPSNFSTKVRSVGVWFDNYDGSGLSATPRIYLIPVGMDILRSPRGDTLATREFQIIDHRIPIPFPVGGTDFNNPDWIPINDTLDTSLGTHRRYSRFRAFHDDGFDLSEMVTDSRLIGRSVWNTEWLMVIPGGTLLADPDEGLDVFIGDENNEGIRDIKLFFETYSFSGN